MRNDKKGIMPQEMASLSSRIRLARKRASLTQSELGDKIDCNQGTVARWEGGQQTPTFKNLEAISTATGIDFMWLIGGGDPLPALVKPALHGGTVNSLDVFRVPLAAMPLPAAGDSPEAVMATIMALPHETAVFPNDWIGSPLPATACLMWVSIGFEPSPAGLVGGDRVMVDMSDRAIRDGIWMIHLGAPVFREIRFVGANRVLVAGAGAGFEIDPSDISVYGRVCFRLTQV